jgi:hypothetical protein
MLRIFISYSRENQNAVKTLVQDMEAVGHKAWFDQQLTGGQVWWNEVLANIRDCDLFVFALAPHALNSNACKLEYNYAFDLKKTILPVMVAHGVSANLLPEALSKIQFVDYRSQDKQAALALLRALDNLPPPQPLPAELPTPPEAPISYLGSLKDQVETTATLSFEAQTALLLKLKERLNHAEESNDVRYLLSQMRNRDDLFAKVAKEIDDLLRNIQSSTDPLRQDRVETSQPRVSLSNQTDLSQAQVDEAATPGEESLLDKLLGRRTAVYKGHTIEIKRTYSGTEIVLYDGRQVSSKISMFKPTHSFQIVEDNQPVQYEVVMRPRMLTLGMSLWCEVKRNGMIIFSDR